MRIEEEQRCFDSHKIHVAKTNRVHVIDLYRHAYREQRPLTRQTHTPLHFLVADMIHILVNPSVICVLVFSYAPSYVYET